MSSWPSPAGSFSSRSHRGLPRADRLRRVHLVRVRRRVRRDFLANALIAIPIPYIPIVAHIGATADMPWLVVVLGAARVGPRRVRRVPRRTR